MIHLYLEQSISAVFSALLLLYQPPLLDILPMYLVFIAFTPWIMRTLVRTGERTVLAVSLLLWLAAHYGLKEWMIGALTGGWLVIDPGAFNLFSWQLLWMGGLWLGHRLQRSQGRAPLTLPRTLWPILAGLALFFFCWRWPWIPVAIDLGSHDWLLDKWRLGPLRLLNFLALLYLTLWLGPYLTRTVIWLKPLALLGRNLLPLFCLHVCCSLLATGFVEWYELPDAWCYLILTLHLALILCLSLLLDWLSGNQRPGATAATPPLCG